MKTHVGIIFWLRTDKPNKRGQVPLSCRITAHGRAAEIGTGIRIEPKDWNGARRKVAGTSDAARRANSHLLQMQNELEDLVADLERQGKVVTAQNLARLYRAGGSVLNMLGLFEAYQVERGSLLGVELAPGTFKQNKTAYNRLSDFLKLQKQNDLRPEEFTPNVADKMVYWLLVTVGHKRNSINKVLRTISRVLTWGVRREYLEKNPLALYQYKQQATSEIKFLTDAELATLTHLSLPNTGNNLALVRDCFVLQCWTGLAHGDLAALNVAAAAQYRNDGHGKLRRVLYVTRAKSTMQKRFECVIPLMPEAERILALYGDKMPVPSNQNYNLHLKKLGALAGIELDKMHSHIGRKTAGTLMLNRGVPLPAVSKFLGHSNTLITQKLYAKLLDSTVVDAFGAVFGSAPALVSPPAAYEVNPPTPKPLALRPARRL